MNTSKMNILLKIESGVTALLFALLFVIIGGYDWWWLLVLFFAIDISAIGYLISPKVGAMTYNIGHTYVFPSVLFIVFLVTRIDWMQFVSLLWLFHISVDRTIGFGLKYPKGFSFTHLGVLGKHLKK